MSKTLVISDALYERLETAARTRGLGTVIDLLERVGSPDRSEARRRVRRIDELRARLAAKYGEMPDSVELLREDRQR